MRNNQAPRINRVLLLIAMLGSSLAGWSQQTTPDLPIELRRPELVSVNRMPMRAESYRYESAELAIRNDQSGSKYFRSLNGAWKFSWVQDPRTRPQDFFRTDFNDAGWGTIPVPANWELNGFGLPIYVNQPYEFAGHAKMHGKLNPPDDIPVDNNPVGSYRRSINIPADWDGRQVFIHLGAVKSAFFLWINGRQVGYSEDSKLAAEFDITPYIKTGENLVALQVYRWSDASYLECQDMWRISGIERDVFVYSTPRVSLFDFKAVATLENGYRDGLLDLSTEIRSFRAARGWHAQKDSFTVSYQLLDAEGKKLIEGASEQWTTVLAGYKTSLQFKARINSVHAWSAETPYLYTLLLSLKDRSGKVLETVPQKIGFRSVEIIDRNFLVNGKRIFLKGVNRHEHHPRTGHVLTHADMLLDITMMKRLNVNAVRSSHYPADPHWLDLCDQYGLYVVDEANIESHGRGYDLQLTLGNDPRWREPQLERITRMYERDKNHASIVTWSLGNEAGNGINFYEGYSWLKARDARPVQYERAEEDYNTDLLVPQYPAPSSMARFAKGNPDRPMIMSEYAHIMGNSLGNFQDYWDVIESHPYLQGGFIWEWIDQSIDTVKNGRRIKAYGGDFPLQGPVDENLSDNNFCVKGVVTAYRELTPMAIEIRKVLQPVKGSWLGNGQVKIRNGYFFRDLSNLRVEWELLEDGLVVERGALPALNAAAGDSEVIRIPMKRSVKDDHEYFLNTHYRLRSAEPLLEAGFELGYDQFALSGAPKPILHLNGLSDGAARAATKPGTTPTSKKVTSSLVVIRSTDAASIRGKSFRVDFDLKNGILTGYTRNGNKLLTQGPVPSYWRAPTDNDFGSGFNISLRMWRDAYAQGVMVSDEVMEAADNNQRSPAGHNDQRVSANSHERIKAGDHVRVLIRKNLVNGDAISTQVFDIYADGSIRVSNEFEAVRGKYPLLLRMGTDLVADQRMQNITWYGRGPGENYWDRKASSIVGLYKQTIDQQYFPYARPQESGNKTDVRWFSVTDQRGLGLRFEWADTLLNFSALPFSFDDLDPQEKKGQFHSGELNKQDRIYLHVDLQQTGVQGIDTWGAWPLEQYRVRFATHRYSYFIRPI